MTTVKIFSGTATRHLAERIAHAYGTNLGGLEIQRFSDGEICPYFTESIRGSDVFLVQSTCPPADNIMELLLMVDAAKRASANTVTVVTPYFGYARQDRKDKSRVAIGAKLFANLLTASGATRVMTCDLHAGQIQGFFDIPLDHLKGATIFIPYLRDLKLPNLLFASPDIGSAGRVRSYASHLDADIVICDKYRKKANEIAGMQVIGDVSGKDVVIVDDLIDTGGTLCKAAEAIMEKGANSVRAVCSHPVLSGNAYANIENSKLEELIVLDTIPLKSSSPKIKVLSVAELFAKAIRKIHDHESISSLFL